MTTAHVHAAAGVTGPMLLGALIGAGASVERIEEAVHALGAGSVKLVVGRVARGGRDAWTVRIHAPEQTGPAGSWPQVREVLEHAEVPDPVRRRALGAFGRLVEAEAASLQLRADDLLLPPVGALDDLATIVGVCAAVHELGLTTMTVGPVGVGHGVLETAEGPVELPTFAVRRLLDGFETVVQDVTGYQLTTAAGAALLAELARPGPNPTSPPTRDGRGAGDRGAPHDPALRVVLFDVDGTPEPAGSDT